MAVLTKENLAVVEAASKNNNYNLDHCKLEDGVLWASDGHCMFGSTLTRRDEDYPDMGVNGFEYDGCMLLPADVLNKVEKNIPKKTRVEAIKAVQVLIDEDYKHFVTTDLDTVQDVKIKHGDHGGLWPDQKALFSMHGGAPAKATFTLGIDVLETLVKVMKRAGAESVTFEAKEGPDATPIMVESTGIVGLLMPYIK